MAMRWGRGGRALGWVRTPLPAMEEVGGARDGGGERQASQQWRISTVEDFFLIASE